MGVIHSAIVIAKRAHNGQTCRDGKTPYITHLRDVANRVSIAGHDVETVTVAWLHDILENTSVTQHDLLQDDIPQHLVEDVEDLTRGRFVTYREYILNLKYKATDRARHVKVHDLLSNISDYPSPGQIRRYSRALKELTFDYWKMDLE